ncbi:hypothetical protein Micbo1qcDRAFT_181059 [Microdochium bolleyi]|uniref:Uncharacterized protein n=1 Tax=Microdochium bolleyi TaxID=196109 RepID=A0A136IJW1_9PEZI|nr:hypothetical protein Micbo1qcDRAFT_181059 [Microdochium bolleyi]
MEVPTGRVDAPINSLCSTCKQIFLHGTAEPVNRSDEIIQRERSEREESVVSQSRYSDPPEPETPTGEDERQLRETTPKDTGSLVSDAGSVPQRRESFDRRENFVPRWRDYSFKPYGRPYHGRGTWPHYPRGYGHHRGRSHYQDHHFSRLGRGYIDAPPPQRRDSGHRSHRSSQFCTSAKDASWTPWFNVACE